MLSFDLRYSIAGDVLQPDPVIYVVCPTLLWWTVWPVIQPSADGWYDPRRKIQCIQSLILIVIRE